jgi:hypothetical protein
MKLLALGEDLGRVVGLLLAPVTGAFSLLRHARMFHPEGVVYASEVDAASDTPWPEVAARLAGPALIRVSTAWWRHGRELPDALGLAIRFRRREQPSSEPDGGDQDLLLATIRHPWTTTFAPLTTHVHDFLDNDYYGVSPFFVDGIGLVYLRAVGSRPQVTGDDRGQRLARAVADRTASWRIEARSAGQGQWRPLAQLRPRTPAQIDQAALRFWPFRDGRGVRPRGFVHELRRAAYRASWAMRPHGGAHTA